MMIKQCGTCKWWDKDNAEEMLDFSVANCLYEIPALPDSIIRMRQTEVANCQGQDCPVYEQTEETK